MSNTTIQIKRSTTTATPTSLATGELAYSGNSSSNGLFIGLPDGSNTVTKIAGGKYGFLDNANTGNSTVAVIEGGKLTANAVLVTDANSSINELRTEKLIINTSGNTELEVTSITAFANASQIGANAGASNTELATTLAVKTYVDARTSAVGSALGNTQLAFSNGTVFIGSDALVFDYAANTLTVGGPLESGNTTISGFANITSTLASGNTTITGFVDVSSYANVTGPLTVSNTADVGNTTITGFANISSTLAAGNTTVTGFANISSTLAAGNTTVSGFINVSSSADIVGPLTVTNTSALGNTTITGFANISSTLDAGNTTVTGFANISSTLAAGNTTVSGFINVSSTADIGGNTTITGFANISSTLAAGDTTITGFANISSTLAAGNTTITGFANVTGDGSFGGDLSVSGNVALGSDTSDVISINGYVNTNITPSANVTYDLGTSALRFSNVYAQSFIGTNAEFTDVVVSGNLAINGTLTTIDTDNVVVEDSLIKLSRNNTSTDSLDIGFYGAYGDSGAKYTGLFRDQSDGGRYKLFTGLTVDPTSTVDTSNDSFTIATLETFLVSGALTSNTTVVSITANSTVDVTIVANDVTADSLTFTGVSGQDIFVANSSGGLTALSLGTEGQVLQSNGTALVYAGLDGGTF